jgi:NitT/TauT family transport system substrate-binding protein
MWRAIRWLGLAVMLLPSLAACGGSSPPGSSASASTTAASASPTPEPLVGAQVSVAGNYLPYYVADKLGFFARHGLQFELLVADTPTKVVQAIASGSADIAWNAPDSSILAIEQGAPLTMVGATQNAIPYSLIVQPGIRSFAELRGKTFAVSSLNSGPAILMRKMFAANGLAEGDYDFVSVGGTAERFAAIRSGAVTGGLLLQPEDLRLMSEGFVRLALATDYVPRYQWLTLLTRREWAREHRDRVVRAIRALQDAVRWSYAPPHREEAIALIMEMTHAPREQAAATYDLYAQLRIWPEDLAFEDAAMRAVIELMGELGQLTPPLPEPARYIDTTYLALAAQR